MLADVLKDTAMNVGLERWLGSRFHWGNPSGLTITSP